MIWVFWGVWLVEGHVSHTLLQQSRNLLQLLGGCRCNRWRWEGWRVGWVLETRWTKSSRSNNSRNSISLRSIWNSVSLSINIRSISCINIKSISININQINITSISNSNQYQYQSDQYQISISIAPSGVHIPCGYLPSFVVRVVDFDMQSLAGLRGDVYCQRWDVWAIRSACAGKGGRRQESNCTPARHTFPILLTSKQSVTNHSSLTCTWVDLQRQLHM